LEQLQQLDHIALDIKEAALHAYLCTPVLANVPKQLTKTNAADRALLDDVISSFSETSCAVNQAAIQTVAHLPAPQTTYRIDRENLSAAPAPRYWTYRLQIGGNVNGGILMETGISFKLADLKDAFTASNRSVPLLTQGQPALGTGHYVRVSAPDWLREIVAA
jgi:hypothetical protein